ncbi:MAG: hypothetical protein KIH64_003850 [Mycobacterium sp.]|nr:hypothetical protein [Mycobacterium sp.]
MSVSIARKIIASLVAPVAAAAAIATAPAAGASSNPSSCRESGGARVCQKQGHSSLHAKPTPRTPNGSLFSSPWLPGYGKGILPPLIALD